MLKFKSQTIRHKQAGRRGSFAIVASLALCLSVSSPTWAQTVAGAQETPSSIIAGSADDIRQLIVEADMATELADRRAAYQQAHDKFNYLERMAIQPGSTGPALAREALEKLGQDAITGDIVTTALLSALLSGIDASKTSDDLLDYRTEINGLIPTIQDPALRASSQVEVALKYVQTDPDQALFMLNAVTADIDMIDQPETRNSTLNLVAHAAASLKAPGAAGLVDKAIGQMWPSRMRGFAHYTIAKAALNGTSFENATSGDLLKAAQVALLQGNLERAATLTLAIDPDDGSSRSDGLNALLEVVISKNDVDYFPTVATAYTDDKAQEAAITKLVNARIEDNRLLDVVEVTDLLPAGPVKANVEFTIASALHKAGYGDMAKDAFARGRDVVEGLSTGPLKDAAIGEAIMGAVDMDRTKDGLKFFGELGAYDDVSETLRQLVRALADDGKIKDAEKVAERISDPDDIQAANASIFVAKVKDGDLEAGIAGLDSLSIPQYKGRLQSQIVKSYAEDDRFNDALGIAETIQNSELAVQAFLRVAEQAVDDGEKKIAETANRSALRIAKSEADSQTRDKLLVDVVESVARYGLSGEAQAVAAEITSTRLRTQALGIIGKRSAIEEDVTSSLAMLEEMPASGERDAAIADALLGRPVGQVGLKQVIDRIDEFSDSGLRVQSFKTLAENQLNRLDVYGVQTAGSDLAVAPVSPAAPAVPVVTNAKVVYAYGNMQMIKLDAMQSQLAGVSYPDIKAEVADLRAMVPTPRPGKVSVTLAHLSPYIETFLEGTKAGQAGLIAAGKLQGTTTPRVIVVESGVYTLGSLADHLQGTSGFEMIERDGDTVTLRAPILVSEGATLILSGQQAQTYRLSATGGAFIAVAGDLFVLDTAVTSWDERASAALYSSRDTRDVYRPFIVGWSNSRVYIGGSVIEALGYAAPKSFGLSFSAGPIPVVDHLGKVQGPQAVIVQNMFRNLDYGFYSYQADNIRIIGNLYDDSVEYAIDPAGQSQKLLLALNTVRDTQGRHGIMASSGANDGWIVGNVSFDNAGSGMILNGNSTGTLLYGNVAFENGQDGLTLYESSCNLAVANEFFGNKRAGVKLRNSINVGLWQNRILSNQGAGIESTASDDYQNGQAASAGLKRPGSSFHADKNVISLNGEGIKASGGAGFSLSEQGFLGQRGQIFSGDAQAFEGYLLRYAASGGVALVSSRCVAAEGTSCRLTDDELSKFGQDVFAATGNGGQCKQRSEIMAVTSPKDSASTSLTSAAL